MRVVAETLEKRFGRLMQHAVVRDEIHPGVQLGRSRELAVEEQVGHFEERAFLGEFFDRVSAIAQDASVAVDIGDLALTRRGVEKSRVVTHDAEIVSVFLDLPEIHGAYIPIRQWELIGFVGAIVDDRERVFAHGSCPLVNANSYGAGGRTSPRRRICNTSRNMLKNEPSREIRWKLTQGVGHTAYDFVRPGGSVSGSDRCRISSALPRSTGDGADPILRCLPGCLAFEFGSWCGPPRRLSLRSAAARSWS